MNNKKFSFYQICHFAIDGKHGVRKLIYDTEGKLISYKENIVKREILDNFIKKSPEYKYVIYSVYQLKDIQPPSDNDILTARSQILNNY